MEKESTKNYDDSNIFSNELLQAIEEKEDKRRKNKTITALKRMIDGEPKNVNPLKEIPEPQMRLFGFSGVFKSAFFDTEDELLEYVKSNNTTLGDVCIIEYLGNVAGRSDVIRKNNRNGKKVFYTAVDEDGYGIYNHERSVYKGEFVWEYSHGSISEMYSAFRDRGITFEDDIYAKIAERNQQLLKMCRENSLFGMGKE